MFGRDILGDSTQSFDRMFSVESTTEQFGEDLIHPPVTTYLARMTSIGHAFTVTPATSRALISDLTLSTFSTPVTVVCLATSVSRVSQGRTFPQHQNVTCTDLSDVRTAVSKNKGQMDKLSAQVRLLRSSVKTRVERVLVKRETVRIKDHRVSLYRYFQNSVTGRTVRQQCISIRFCQRLWMEVIVQSTLSTSPHGQTSANLKGTLTRPWGDV